ncbi:energy transducer TonB [Brenneria izadpanahii]|uniref:Energy transducer TonB n=1 Tax=Brenneria izadpanahii TaxID=2722756 RepID=A0ABX7UX66_9GAMM|nr:energy transducer TonB [Brenneria izadpanahii]QTF09990.1 energy transducer TonB [Brenneria izadpanahii]
MSASDYFDDAVNKQDIWPRAAAAAIALAVHLAAGALLLQHWQMRTPPAPVIRHLHTTLVTLPIAQPSEAPPVAPPPAPEPAFTPPQTPPVAPPAPAPVTPPATPDKGLPARQQQERTRKAEQARRQAQEKQRQQQQRLAQQKAEDEQRRQSAQQRQAAERAAAENARQAADMSARQYLPISKQAPDYPEKALSRKIEGDCTVVYRVNRRGEVEDPRAESDCNPMFVRPSLSAARTFRYQPRIINGQPVDVPQVKNTFHYRIK